MFILVTHHKFSLKIFGINLEVVLDFIRFFWTEGEIRIGKTFFSNSLIYIMKIIYN